MSDDENRKTLSRRDFLWAGMGAVTGAGVGALAGGDGADQKSSGSPRNQPKKPSSGSGPFAKYSFAERVTGGAVAGGMLAIAARRVIEGQNPPADTERERRRIADDFETGRRHEQWSDDAHRNPNSTGRNPDGTDDYTHGR